MGQLVRIGALARFALTTSAALLFGSCGGIEPTEVVVVVTSDIAVPAELDRVVIDVVSPQGTIQSAEADLVAAGLPRSLGIYNPDGPLGPYRVEAVGYKGASPVVRRRAVFNFTRDESLEIELPLLVDCLEPGIICNCPSASSCSTCDTGRVCVSATVAPQPFDGVGRELSDELDLDL